MDQDAMRRRVEAARVVDDAAESGEAIGALVAKYRQYDERPPTGPVLAVDIGRWSGWSAT